MEDCPICHKENLDRMPVTFRELIDMLEQLDLQNQHLYLGVFDADNKTFKQIDSVAINGAFIQLNTENWKKDCEEDLPI